MFSEGLIESQRNERGEQNKVKDDSLLDIYKLNKQALVVTMLIGSAFLIVCGIVVILMLSHIWWVGLIFFLIAAASICVSVFVYRYLDKKIKEMEEEQKNKR